MNIKFIITLLLIISLGLFMFLTEPNNIPLQFLMVPFLIIAILIFIFTKTLIDFFLTNKDKTKSGILSAGIAIFGINFLLLRSVDQLTFQDSLISVAVTVMLVFYINKFALKS